MDEGQGISILSAVDVPATPAIRADARLLTKSLPWLGMSMLLLITLAFWLEWRGDRKPEYDVAAQTVPPSVSSPVPAVATTLPAAGPEESQPTPPQAATIEIEPPPETAPVPASAAPQPSVAAMLAQPVSKLPAPKAKADGKTVGSTVASKAAAGKTQRSPFAAMETPAPTVRSKPVAPANATDVDLLAALLTHGSTQALGSGRTAPARPSARPKLSTRLSSLELQPSASGRLSLCKQMTAPELARCKARACAGLWGRDAACPAGSEPPVRATAG